MKTTARIVLMVFFVFTFCEAQIETDDVWDKIEKCSDNYYNNTLCLDVDEIEKCIKKIVPTDDIDAKQIDWKLNEMIRGKTACPGINGKDKCIFSETKKCMEKFRNHRYHENKEICNEEPSARACLVTFNATCNVDVVKFNIEELDDVARACKYGYFENGPCSASVILNCTDPIYTVTESVDLDNWDDTEYNCKPAVVIAAKRCLGSRRVKCTTDYQQDMIKEEWKLINDACPPSK